MDKINPFGLEVDDVPAQVITAKQANKASVSLSVLPLDTVLSHLAHSEANTIILEHIGDIAEGIPPRSPFPPVGGKVVTLSESLVRTCSLLWAQQEPQADGSRLYSAREIIALSFTLPIAFNELSAKAAQVTKDYRASQGNATGGVAGEAGSTSSASPSSGQGDTQP